MRLSNLLSKPPKKEFTQVDGFLVHKKGNVGQQAALSIGDVALNYYCAQCEDLRTFYSKGKITCIFVSKNLISIDCVLTCVCGANVVVWFLVECNDDITAMSPKVRILKRSEKLPENVSKNYKKYAEFDILLDKAEQAYNENLGAGSIVYLRKIFEIITIRTASVSGIPLNTDKGKRRTFKDLLNDVECQCHIIPEEFSKNGYKLFGELSDVVHGEYDEELGLKKFEPLYRLVIGILENVQNKEEFNDAIRSLEWADEETEE